MSKATKQLIFIGDQFYYESDHIMGPIYEEHDGAYHNTAWWHVANYLNDGIKIKIRPATKKELKYFQEQLEEVKLLLKNK